MEPRRYLIQLSINSILQNKYAYDPSDLHVRLNAILLCLLNSQTLILKFQVLKTYWLAARLYRIMTGFPNKTFYFFQVLIFCLTTQAHSQTLISLPGRRITIKNPKFYISEIIDARSNREMVGIVQRGLKNRQETASLENGFQDELKGTLDAFLKPRAGLTPLIVRVLKLNVYERTLLNSETAVAELIVEFYKKTDRGLALVKSAGSSVTSSGFDVTGSHGRNIELCLADCLGQVNDFLLKDPVALEGPLTDYGKLSDPPHILDDYEHPILRDTFLVKGVYRNFIEFRNNAPGIVDFSIKEKMNYTGTVYDVTRGVVKTADGKETNVWGYADDEGIFIKLGEEFFQVFAEDGILWFEGYDVSDFKTDVSIPGRSIFMAAFTGYLFYQIRVDWNAEKIKYAINMGNGDLIPLN